MITNKSMFRVMTILVVLAVLMSGWRGASVSAKQPAPKYIIVMISDGMGYNTNLAASYYRFGAADQQEYHRFPFKHFMSTYALANSKQPSANPDACLGKTGYDPVAAWSNFNYVKSCPTDSASAATAMASGVKTYNAALNMDLYGKRLVNVMERAETYGKSTGVVSTVELSHATPAGFVAHNLSRNDYEGIAKEMIWDSQVDVIMGAGIPGTMTTAFCSTQPIITAM